jgi:probable phosphomutase (TIGR03848 family)
LTTFFFVRHAVTSHTGHKLSGRLAGIPLTDEGRQQAETVAEKLSEIPFKAVFTSPIDRTLETARVIARRQGLKVQTAEGFTEVEFGKWTDKSFKVLRRTKLWSQVQRFPSGTRFPEGESFLDVQARAIAEVDRLRAEHPKDVICCVSHADVIKLIVSYYLGVHMDLFQRMDIGPASVSVVAVGEPGPRVLTVNSTGDGFRAQGPLPEQLRGGGDKRDGSRSRVRQKKKAI